VQIDVSHLPHSCIILLSVHYCLFSTSCFSRGECIDFEFDPGYRSEWQFFPAQPFLSQAVEKLINPALPSLPTLPFFRPPPPPPPSQPPPKPDPEEEEEEEEEEDEDVDNERKRKEQVA